MSILYSTGYNGVPIVHILLAMFGIFLFLLQLCLFRGKYKAVRNVPLYAVLLVILSGLVIGLALFGVRVFFDEAYDGYLFLAAVVMRPWLVVGSLAIALAWLLRWAVRWIKKTVRGR